MSEYWSNVGFEIKYHSKKIGEFILWIVLILLVVISIGYGILRLYRWNPSFLLIGIVLLILIVVLIFVLWKFFDYLEEKGKLRKIFASVKSHKPYETRSRYKIKRKF